MKCPFFPYKPALTTTHSSNPTALSWSLWNNDLPHCFCHFLLGTQHRNKKKKNLHILEWIFGSSLHLPFLRHQTTPIRDVDILEKAVGSVISEIASGWIPKTFLQAELHAWAALHWVISLRLDALGLRGARHFFLQDYHSAPVFAVYKSLFYKHCM